MVTTTTSSIQGANNNNADRKGHDISDNKITYSLDFTVCIVCDVDCTEGLLRFLSGVADSS